ncbi:MAG TPA: DUF1565 domain-containing protein, partial [Acidimicrobiales bacterium]|nr:DUF1565 domain-containing protein [Acidimicrobiales bacterium]
MRLRAGLLTAAVLIAVLPPTAAAAAPAVVHVPGDVATIQAAVDQVTPAGRVVVGPGTYVENVAFRNKELELESVAGPWATVIDGGGRDTAVTIRDGQTRATTLRGFTIRNGGTTGGRGGGIVVANASPTITDNVITGNRGDEGAGVWVTDGSPLIAANAIRGNSAGGRGGGIDLGGAWGTEIVGNLIEGNTAAFGGGIQM